MRHKIGQFEIQIIFVFTRYAAASTKTYKVTVLVATTRAYKSSRMICKRIAKKESADQITIIQ